MRRIINMVLCMVAALLALSCGGSGDSGGEPVKIGSRLPGFSIKSLDGATVTNSSLEGSASIVNFWATWCAPCQKEIPDLNEVAAKSGAKVLGIALDEDGAKTVRPFVERHAISYTVALGSQELFQRFNGLGIPYTLVLDRSLRVINIYRGPATRESLEQDLKKIAAGA